MKKNVILIINRDDILFVKPLDTFLQKYHNYIKHIYFTSFLIPDKSLRISRLSFTLWFLLVSLYKKIGSWIIPVGNYRRLCSLPGLAKWYSITSNTISNINDIIFINELKGQNAKIVLSNSSQIYKKEILNISGLKFYNFHPSLLPNNKGSLC